MRMSRDDSMHTGLVALWLTLLGRINSSEIVIVAATVINFPGTDELL